MPAGDPLKTALAVISMFAIVVGLVFLVSFMILFRPWLRSFLLGTPVPMIILVAMRLRGTPLDLVTEAYSTLKRRGEAQKISDVELVYLDQKAKIVIAEDLIEAYRQEHPPAPVRRP